MNLCITCQQSIPGKYRYYVEAEVEPSCAKCAQERIKVKGDEPTGMRVIQVKP